MPAHIPLSSRCVSCWVSHGHAGLRCESCPSRPVQSADETADQQRRADLLMAAGHAHATAMRRDYEAACMLRRGAEPSELVAQAAERAREAIRLEGEACGVVSGTPCVACLAADAELELPGFEGEAVPR
jgi:hypothetical protein